jgi:Uma2 family endonuclease
MAALPDLITVAQYRKLQDPDGSKYELHNGEVVLVSFARRKHHLMQRRFVKLLEERLSGFGEVAMEVAYRAVPEFDLVSP